MPKVRLHTVLKTHISVEIEATKREIIHYNDTGEWPSGWRGARDANVHRAIANAKRLGIELDFDDSWVS